MYSKNQRLEIGKRIQGLRGARDQRAFAEAVESVQQTISKYERGEIPRSWLFLARLAREEGVNLNELLIGLETGPALVNASREAATRSTNGAQAPVQVGAAEERPRHMALSA